MKRTFLLGVILGLILVSSADAGPFRRAGPGQWRFAPSAPVYASPQGYMLTPGQPVTVPVQPRPFYPPLIYPNQGYPTQGYIAPQVWYYPAYYAAPVYFAPFSGCAGRACGR
jgi:hypothetical protein